MPATSESAAFEPNAAQLERAHALRRFNWIFVYTPVSLALAAILVIVGLLLWGSLAPHIRGTSEFASAVADIIIILTILPLFVLCAIVPAAAIALVIYRRKKPKRTHDLGHTLLWRLDALLDTVQAKSVQLLPRAAGAVIEGHARAAYVGALISRLKGIFGRSYLDGPRT